VALRTTEPDRLADQLGKKIDLIQLRNRGPTDHLVSTYLAEVSDEIVDGLRGGGDGSRHAIGTWPKVAVVVAYVISTSIRVRTEGVVEGGD
jgi:hypothetical protein